VCGIVGLSMSSSYRPSALAQDLGRAVRAIAHRGPDSSGTHMDDHFALGHVRLAIIDLSETGAQPMYSADRRYVIVFVGEIYNYVDLRKKLEARGVKFIGTSDTEVLLYGFIHFGPDVVTQLNGMFTFAVADLLANELFLARDQMGVKPLYYSIGGFGVAFSSEIKALLEIVPINRELDPVAISQYLTYLWGPGERTPFKRVLKLPPGTALFIRDGQVRRSWTFWSLPNYRPRRDWTERACAQDLKTCVDEAVERQLVSDAPVGAFLSGGVDSTAVVAAARKHKPELNCFTIAMDESRAGEMVEDLPYARLAAKSLGVRLTEVKVSPDDIVCGLGKMVADLDEPLADPAGLNLFLMSKAAGEDGIKVLLSGTGGDDLFSGYRRHMAGSYNRTWDYFPGAFRGQIAGVASKLGASSHALRGAKKVLSNLASDADERLMHLYAWTPLVRVRELMQRDFDAELDAADPFHEFRAVMDANRDVPDVEKLLRLDQRFFLADHNLIYTDKMGMAASVEIRVPLLDLELVKFAAQVPAEWKMHGWSAKRLFKESQKDCIPAEILNRKKTGFGVPLRAWMRGPMRDRVRDLLSPDTICKRGLFNASTVNRMLLENDADTADTAYSLFSLMCIELWCRRYVDGVS